MSGKKENVCTKCPNSNYKNEFTEVQKWTDKLKIINSFEFLTYYKLPNSYHLNFLECAQNTDSQEKLNEVDN